ncbi:Ppx/GppA phosphatase family protein [Massilia sp. 9096]|uniref:Ppx/GppA phosphatase family protein n=1 Tax=Massilia sp. 9096 TaxID=1500894 RepID=UPI0005645194|nr:Ppx/GppA phosphatase family protein [Massilia sp. 9096]
MYAAVDLGSNSFRLHIGEPLAGQIHIVRTARDPIRLAAGLGPDNMLGEQAVETALRCLREFAAILRQQRLDAVRVVATNTMRVARNAEQLLPRFEQAIGYPIEVISGEEEGRLIYMGVARALGRTQGRRLVIDIGGGSTELIVGDASTEGDAIRLVESFSIGTHPQSAAYFQGGHISADAFETAVNAARARFEDMADRYRALGWDAAFGSSGTIRAISEVIARNGIGDGTMSYASLLALRDRLVRLGHVDAFDLPGVKRERVIVMTGGLSILIGVMQELGVKSMTAINAGLRLGVLSDLELRANRRDRRDGAIEDCLRRFGVDAQRAARTASIARRLIDKLAPQDEAVKHHLLRACLLHEVGQAISHTGAHKHAAYIVEHADLPGFTAREQRLMSTIVLGQKGNLRKVREALGAPDLAKAVLAMRLAAVFMHARVDADVEALKLRMKGRIEIETPRAWLDQRPTVAAWFEKEAAAWSEVGVAFQVGQA